MHSIAPIQGKENDFSNKKRPIFKAFLESHWIFVLHIGFGKISLCLFDKLEFANSQTYRIILTDSSFIIVIIFNN